MKTHKQPLRKPSEEPLGESIVVNGHMFVHVAACPCQRDTLKDMALLPIDGDEQGDWLDVKNR